MPYDIAKLLQVSAVLCSYRRSTHENSSEAQNLESLHIQRIETKHNIHMLDSALLWMISFSLYQIPSPILSSNSSAWSPGLCQACSTVPCPCFKDCSAVGNESKLAMRLHCLFLSKAMWNLRGWTGKALVHYAAKQDWSKIHRVEFDNQPCLQFILGRDLNSFRYTVRTMSVLNLEFCVSSFFVFLE